MNSSSDKKSSRTIRILAIGLVVVLAVGYLLAHRQRVEISSELAKSTASVQGEAPPVTAVRVKLATGEAVVRLPGETAAWYQSTLYARVSGYVDQWKGDIGDRVHQGQVLATISTPDLDAELAAAQARLQVDQAEVNVRQSNRSFAQTTYQRWRDSPVGVVAEQEREAKKADLDSAIAQLAAAEAKVNLDRAEVTRLSSLSAFKALTAPIDGVITERRIDVGNLVTAGSTSATMPLYRVAQDKQLRVFVDVPQNLASLVHAGIEATVLPSDPALKPIKARVARTASSVDAAARTLRVELDLANGDHRLVPGLYVQVEFDTHAAALAQVPAAAMLFRSSGPQVAVIDSQGKVAFRPVVIGRDEGNRVDLASGVEPGELVALNLSAQIAGGTKVQAQVEGDPSSMPKVAGGKQ